MGSKSTQLQKPVLLPRRQILDRRPSLRLLPARRVFVGQMLSRGANNAYSILIPSLLSSERSLPSGPRTVDRSGFFDLGVDVVEATGIKDLDEEVHEELYRDKWMFGTFVLVASSLLPFPVTEFEVDGWSTQTGQRIGPSAVTGPVFDLGGEPLVVFAYST